MDVASPKTERCYSREEFRSYKSRTRPPPVRNVSTTLIYPGLEFKLGLGHMAPPIAGHAGSGLPEGKIACADPG